MRMLVLLSGEEDRDIHDRDYVVLFEEEGGEKFTRKTKRRLAGRRGRGRGRGGEDACIVSNTHFVLAR